MPQTNTFKTSQKELFLAIKRRNVTIEENRILIDEIVLDKSNLVEIQNPNYNFWTGQKGFKFIYKVGSEMKNITVFPSVFAAIENQDEIIRMQDMISDFCVRNQILNTGEKYNKSNFTYDKYTYVVYIFMFVFNYCAIGGLLSAIFGIVIHYFLYPIIYKQTQNKILANCLALIPWLIISIIIGLLGIGFLKNLKY